MQLHKPDGRPDYEALAVRADKQAEQAEALHLIALWRELATTYRELADYHSFRPGDAEPVGFGNIPRNRDNTVDNPVDDQTI